MADEKPDEGGAAVAAGPAQSGGGGKLVVIISIVNMVVSLAVIGLLVMAHMKEASKPTVDDIVEGEAHGGAHGGGSGDGHGGGHGSEGGGDPVITDAGKIIPLDPFIVNLATGVGSTPRYVKINVSVELEQDVSDDEFKVKLPRVRDTIINLVNSKKVSEIQQPAGREKLKSEIRKSLNTYMITSKVKDIYFTNFAISQ